ncbi:hypothetical protein AYL99_07226 [Fonsecaea erecta]|uniref:Uncharacterized protein n=1 Tax=Fonsecaea erecta TaxID=1367422 RepID=A0A178ZF77_9EURO|nr:hypothetical protein AYL99_07226 [Fonsecaea erecta]OAP58136.1 hypothetical protein AYL99_07226 [Fonsecaea erecta]
MSADLYAAFVEEDPPPKPDEKTNIKPYSAISAHGTDVANIQSSTPTTGGVQATQQQNVSSPLWHRDTGGRDVLFDAEQADSGDEFGDFETAGGSANDLNNTIRQDNSLMHQPPMSSEAVSREPLDLDSPDAFGVLNKPMHPEIKASTSPGVRRIQSGSKGTAASVQPPWDDDWGDFEETETQPPPQSIPEVTAQPSDDEWEPVEDNVCGPMQQAHSKEPVPTKSTTAEIAPQPSLDTLASERPSNVPPPSSLLQLLSSVFKFIHQSNADSVVSKSELASKVLVAFRVSSRIVAGRTLRWKRDTVLAQSVRIGQSGKSGGMKLAALNKSETTKEERDTQEMIRDWSSYLHEFNSILAQAEVPPLRMKLSASPSIKRLEQTNRRDPSKQCALCGLKRTERLGDVDIDADDIFGEFWVEHWGHKDCVDFWYSYKNMLGHR